MTGKTPESMLLQVIAQAKAWAFENGYTDPRHFDPYAGIYCYWDMAYGIWGPETLPIMRELAERPEVIEKVNKRIICWCEIFGWRIDQ